MLLHGILKAVTQEAIDIPVVVAGRDVREALLNRQGYHAGLLLRALHSVGLSRRCLPVREHRAVGPEEDEYQCIFEGHQYREQGARKLIINLD